GDRRVRRHPGERDPARAELNPLGDAADAARPGRVHVPLQMKPSHHVRFPFRNYLALAFTQAVCAESLLVQHASRRNFSAFLRLSWSLYQGLFPDGWGTTDMTTPSRVSYQENGSMPRPDIDHETRPFVDRVVLSGSTRFPSARTVSVPTTMYQNFSSKT